MGLYVNLVYVAMQTVFGLIVSIMNEIMYCVSLVYLIFPPLCTTMHSCNNIFYNIILPTLRVNYWTHAGTLDIDGLKMSKRLKNFTSIKAIMESMSARHIRIAFLQQSWCRRMNYSDDNMKAGEEFEKRVVRFCNEVKTKIRQAGNPAKSEQSWNADDKELSAFVGAMLVYD